MSMSDDEKTARALTMALSDQAPKVRRTVAESLGRFGGKAGAAVEVLHQRLSDEDTSVRVSAAKALWQIEKNAEEVLPVLIEALHDPTVGWQAPFVLGEIGT